MISLGVVSDSHQNTDNLSKAVKYLVEEKKVQKLAHLGDYYEDMEKIEYIPDLSDMEILKVPGSHHYQYSDSSVMKRIKINFGNLRFLITHVPRKHQNDSICDISIENMIEKKQIDVLLYGHTHEFKIYYNNDTNILYINPGHLKDFDEQGTPPTFAYIEIESSSIYVAIYNLVFLPLLERRYII
ncbi:YfcE family phosphodiesterase [Candidatus Dependentiae bacterium]|nr:YfcE family phosphodiesterase [Candidatus Dependentiae bacterium]